MKELLHKINWKIAISTTLGLAAWAYIGAFILGAEWRFIENSLAAICAFYCAYRLLTADNSFVSSALAVMCIGVGLNAFNESFWFLYRTREWDVATGVTIMAEFYAIGNHIRNPTLIVSFLTLSGVLNAVAKWLSELVNE